MSVTILAALEIFFNIKHYYKLQIKPKNGSYFTYTKVRIIVTWNSVRSDCIRLGIPLQPANSKQGLSYKITLSLLYRNKTL